jgi:hypothetical protein
VLRDRRPAPPAVEAGLRILEDGGPDAA